MKKLLIVSLLLLNASAFAKTTEYTGLTSTPNDQDTTVMRQNAYIWGQGPNGEDRRIKVGADGFILTSPSDLSNTAIIMGALTFTANSRAHTEFATVSATVFTSQRITFTAKASVLISNVGALGVSVTVSSSSTPSTIASGNFFYIQPFDTLNLTAWLGNLVSTDLWVHVHNENAPPVKMDNGW